MTKDFARKKREPKKTRRHISNKRTANKKTQQSLPVWAWILMGMFLGALIMLLLYMMVVAPPEKSITNNTARQQANKAKQPQPRFDFYQLLKEQEVIVPDTTPELANRPAEDTVYLLQAGSFRNSADADRLRAQLLLLNLAVTIEKISARNGDNWHRVIVGPFTSRSKLAKARSILASNQIDSLLLKRQ